VLTPYSLKIGDTSIYNKYSKGGIAKQLKSKIKIQFKSFESSVLQATIGEIPLDPNL
jgi:hypothetical protein